MSQFSDAIPKNSVPRAVFFMVLSAVLFGFMAIVIRLASKQLHAFEIAFFRNFFGFAFTLPLFFKHGSTILKTDKLHMYIGRCLIGIISMMCGFWAIVHLPLAEAVTISYSTPLFVTILAVLFLGEVVKLRRWSAVLAGFIGVLIIMQPGSHSFSADMMIALVAAVMSAVVAISIKILSRTEKADAIVIYTTMLWVPMSLLPAVFVWEWPQGITWLWIIAAGFFGTTAHLCWTRALKLGDASMLTPISFFQVPVVAIGAWIIFDEKVGTATLIGASIIFISNAYIARREAQLARRNVTDPDINSGTQQR
jgi:drug/metabolite transporter (DMT)-like permease